MLLAADNEMLQSDYNEYINIHRYIDIHLVIHTYTHTQGTYNRVRSIHTLYTYRTRHLCNLFNCKYHGTTMNY